MKPFRLLIAAATTMMTAGVAAGAEIAPWLEPSKTLSWAEFRETLAGDRTGSIGKITYPVVDNQDVSIVELPFAPQKLSSSIAILGDAVGVVRAQVLDDPRLHSALTAEGLSISDVIAMSKVPDGRAIIFVGDPDA
jgi:hypothetical protein